MEPTPEVPAAAPFAISFRPVAADDQELLYRIYASTRTEELAPVPWSDEQKESFLRMQFRAQSADYASNYPDAEFLIILLGGEPAGRLYVHRLPDEVHIIDIALLPERRRGGTGTVILRDLQTAAAADGKPLRIHVERFNPALHLYDRLGFRRTGDDGIYFVMEWRAGAPPPARPEAP
jgi:ribosomal protein S18 acetylase RimI-like enzyme